MNYTGALGPERAICTGVRGGNGLAVPVLLLREGAPHTTQPMGHPRESMLKIKR